MQSAISLPLNQPISKAVASCAAIAAEHAKAFIDWVFTTGAEYYLSQNTPDLYNQFLKEISNE